MSQQSACALLLMVLAGFVQCQNPQDNDCMKQMQVMHQRMAQCCPAPEPMQSVLQQVAQKMAQNGGGGDQSGKGTCTIYKEAFKAIDAIDDDDIVDADKFKEAMEQALDEYKLSAWKETFGESVDKCVESDKNANMFYTLFGITKEECNLDSFLMDRCTHYANQLNCIDSAKKSDPECTEGEEYMKSCAKFWYNIDAE